MVAVLIIEGATLWMAGNFQEAERRDSAKR
jgi:hypothetical protein